jgi:flagellar protein FliL
MAKREEIKEKDEQSEDVVQGQGKKKSSMMMYIIIGVIVLVVLGAGVGGAVFFMSKSSEKKVAATPAIGTMWVMEPLIINLADNNGERYLKVVIQLELTSPEASKEMDVIKPKFRDSTVDLLSNKTYKDLADNIGKQRLRDDIMLRGNSMLMQGKIGKVYFTEFVIQ